VLYDSKEVEHHLMSYFQKLLGSQCNAIRVKWSIMEQGIHLDKEMKVMLCVDFYTIEVKETLWSIRISNSSRLDAYDNKFFQTTWSALGDEVSQAILDFFQCSRLLR